MSLYKTIRRAYHFSVPQKVRHVLYERLPGPLARARRKVVMALEERAPHDDVYDKAYYERFVEPTMAISANTMAATIVRDLAPRTLVDLGCGTGSLLATLKARGVSVRGLEYAAAAIETSRARRLDVDQYDIEHDPLPTFKADVAISTEVAEHLPESSADRFVEALMMLAERTIVLTAAVPSLGGTDHVNEQPNEYWIEKLEHRGARLDPALTKRWRSEWTAAGVAHCFASAVMVFVVAQPAPAN